MMVPQFRDINNKGDAIMNLKWETPQIKDLNDLQKADGNICNTGSQVTAGGFDCTDGLSPAGCLNGNVAFTGTCVAGDTVT
jgi:hypothetical protein